VALRGEDAFVQGSLRDGDRIVPGGTHRVRPGQARPSGPSAGRRIRRSPISSPRCRRPTRVRTLRGSRPW
jgi:hypothetical protein